MASINSTPTTTSSESPTSVLDCPRTLTCTGQVGQDEAFRQQPPIYINGSDVWLDGESVNVIDLNLGWQEAKNHFNTPQVKRAEEQSMNEFLQSGAQQYHCNKSPTWQQPKVNDPKAGPWSYTPPPYWDLRAIASAKAAAGRGERITLPEGEKEPVIAPTCATSLDIALAVPFGRTGRIVPIPTGMEPIPVVRRDFPAVQKTWTTVRTSWTTVQTSFPAVRMSFPAVRGGFPAVRRDFPIVPRP